MESVKINLAAEVAKQYKPTAKAVQAFILNGRKVDLSNIDLKMAEKLVQHKVLEPLKEDKKETAAK